MDLASEEGNRTVPAKLYLAQKVDGWRNLLRKTLALKIECTIQVGRRGTPRQSSQQVSDKRSMPDPWMHDRYLL